KGVSPENARTVAVRVSFGKAEKKENLGRKFHSLHYTQFRTNYSLFMPLYDYIYGTMDETSDTLYEKSLERGEDRVDVVHLTHLTTP
ncbi:unnamed protein product, partial [Brassica oleracea var. botrytis]